jgi:hypothetical protein
VTSRRLRRRRWERLRAGQTEKSGLAGGWRARRGQGAANGRRHVVGLVENVCRLVVFVVPVHIHRGRRRSTFSRFPHGRGRRRRSARDPALRGLGRYHRWQGPSAWWWGRRRARAGPRSWRRRGSLAVVRRLSFRRLRGRRCAFALKLSREPQQRSLRGIRRWHGRGWGRRRASLARRGGWTRMCPLLSKALENIEVRSTLVVLIHGTGLLHVQPTRLTVGTDSEPMQDSESAHRVLRHLTAGCQWPDVRCDANGIFLGFLRR